MKYVYIRFSNCTPESQFILINQQNAEFVTSVNFRWEKCECIAKCVFVYALRFKHKFQIVLTFHAFSVIFSNVFYRFSVSNLFAAVVMLYINEIDSPALQIDTVLFRLLLFMSFVYSEKSEKFCFTWEWKRVYLEYQHEQKYEHKCIARLIHQSKK